MSNPASGTTPARIAGTSDPDEFQMPLPGLYADLELGRGSIRLGADFNGCPSLVRLELIRDWQRSLAGYRHEAMLQFARELTGGATDLAAGERLELFRSACRTLHIDVPTGFDALTTVS